MPLALSTPDTIVALVCAFAAVRGAVKGFAWQVVRTAGLLAALWGAGAWHEGVGAWLEQRVSFVPSAAAPWVAWFGILVGLFLLATYLAWMAKGAIRRVRLGGVDRLAGLAAGATMGLVLVTAGFLVWGSMTSRERLREALEGSVSVPLMAKVVDVVEPLLPADVRERWTDVLNTLDEVAQPAGT